MMGFYVNTISISSLSFIEKCYPYPTQYIFYEQLTQNFILFILTYNSENVQFTMNRAIDIVV